MHTSVLIATWGYFNLRKYGRGFNFIIIEELVLDFNHNCQAKKCPLTVMAEAVTIVHSCTNMHHTVLLTHWRIGHC